MDLLETVRQGAPGEITQRLTPVMPAYDHLTPPTMHVVTEPVAELERLATPADHHRTKYAGRHRRSLLAALLRRIGVVR
jgi:hypothetical protein